METVVNRKIKVNAISEAGEMVIEGSMDLKKESSCRYKLVYVMEGCLTICAEKSEQEVNVGECALIISGENHSSLYIHAAYSKVLVLSFNMECDDVAKICGKNFKVYNAHTGNINILVRTLKGGGGEKENYILSKKSYFLHELANNIEIFLMSLLEIKEYTDKISDAALREFQNIINIMRSNVNENLTVKDIAVKCGMSESNLKKIFSECGDCSVHKYFLKLKITKAMELLEKNFSVAEISEMLSFNNQNYFGVVFKKETGFSPRNYRKNFLQRY